MTNEEYARILRPKIETLLGLRNKSKQLAIEIIGQSLTEDDLFFCSTVDRCMRLLDGMISMLQGRNLTCAGVLLRMQMDNCMRTYAPFITNDKLAVIRCVIYGTAIKDCKDEHGKKLTDGYLKEKLSEIDPGFSKTYDNACGYVHFSDKAFYQTIVACNDDNFELGIGTHLPEKYNDPLLEAADAYIHFVQLQFDLLQPIVDSKRRFDKECNESLHES